MFRHYFSCIGQVSKAIVQLQHWRSPTFCWCRWPRVRSVWVWRWWRGQESFHYLVLAPGIPMVIHLSMLLSIGILPFSDFCSIIASSSRYSATSAQCSFIGLVYALNLLDV